MALLAGMPAVGFVFFSCLLLRRWSVFRRGHLTYSFTWCWPPFAMSPARDREISHSHGKTRGAYGIQGDCVAAVKERKNWWRWFKPRFVVTWSYYFYGSSLSMAESRFERSCVYFVDGRFTMSSVFMKLFELSRVV